MNSGIYGIVNNYNGKIYIGSTNNFRKRWLEHKSTLKSNKHRNRELQHDWNIYGEGYFEFRVLEEAELVLGQRELDHMNRNARNCYNIGRNVPTEESLSTAERQQKRREKLNQIAQAAGYASWSAYETAVLNGKKIAS